MRWNGFEYKIENGKIIILNYTGGAAKVVVPSKIGGFPVVEIGADAFSEDGFSIERIAVPGSVKRIGAGAFKMCMSLTELVLQEGLEVLGEGCLYVAPLRELFFPSTLREVCRPQELGVFPWRVDPANPYYYTDGYALYHRTEEGIELVAVQREDRRKEYRVLQDFPERAFAGQRRSEDLFDPVNRESGDSSAVSAENQRVKEEKKVETGDRSSFLSADCRGKTVSIGPGSFEGHMYLERVILPESVTVIGDDAFSSCQELCEVILPEGVREIGADAFSYCFTLKSIHLPASLRVLGSRALTNTFGWSAPVNGIEEISVSEENPVFRADKSALFEKISQEEKAAPCSRAGRDDRSSGWIKRPARGEDLSGISGEILLKYFGHEREYTIPDMVTEIGFSAFRRCGCHGIRIPASVQTVGEKAFFECGSLEWMYIGADDVTIYIPQTPVYRKSEPASLFHGSGTYPDRAFSFEERGAEPARGQTATTAPIETKTGQACNLNGTTASGKTKAEQEQNPADISASDETKTGQVHGLSGTAASGETRAEQAHDLTGISASGEMKTERDQNPATMAYDYPGYDRLFDTYFYLPDKSRMAVCRLTQPIALGEEQKAVYLNYLQENLTGILNEIHETGDMALLAGLAELGLFTDTTIEACIETVTALHDAKLNSFLLEYRHDQLSVDEFDFTL